MKATLVLDKSGRIVIPKRIRDHLRLNAGSRPRLEVAGEKIQLTHDAPEAKIGRRANGRRVVVGWEGFDAVKAVEEAREEYLERLNASFRK